MRLIFKIITMISVIALNACNKPVVDKTLLSPTTTVANSLNQTLWWKKINDPILTNLIAKALENNNQILAAQSNVLRAQAQLKAAYNAWLPTVDVSANGFIVKGLDSHINPQGGPVAQSIFGQINSIKIDSAYAGFVPTYSLNLLENINNTRLAKSSLARQNALYMSLRLTVISQTAAAYFNLLGQKQQILEQNLLITHLKQLRSLEAIRYKDGANDYTNLASNDQELATNKALIPNLETGLKELNNTLRVLTGQNSGNIINQYSKLTSISNRSMIPSSLPADVLEHRPDLMIAKEDLLISDAHLGLTYARFFPQISLTGLLGGSSAELVHLLKLTTGLGVAQIAAVMPVFNGVLYQEIQAAKASIKMEYYNYIHTLRSALADVDNSLTAYAKAREYTLYQQQAYTASTRSYKLSQSRYKAGYQDLRAVVKAKINLDKARLVLIQAKINEFNALVTAYQALAGGYLS